MGNMDRMDFIVQKKIIEMLDIIIKLEKEVGVTGLEEELKYDVGGVRQLYDRYREGLVSYSVVIYIVEKIKDKYLRVYGDIIKKTEGYGEDKGIL